MQPLLVLVSPLRHAMGTVPLPPVVWAVVAASVALSWGSAEAIRRRVWSGA